MPKVPNRPKAYHTGVVSSNGSRAITASAMVNMIMPNTDTAMVRMPARASRSAIQPMDTNPSTMKAAMNKSPVAISDCSRPATSRSQGPDHRDCTPR